MSSCSYGSINTSKPGVLMRPAKIGDLFSEDALYFYSPFDELNPLRGREAIVADWLEGPDPP